MASQKDMFHDSDGSVSEKRNCISLPTSVAINYEWIILFNWEPKDSAPPFKVFDRVHFDDIKEEWIQGQLKPSSRSKKLNLVLLPNQTVSLFGKIDSSEFL